MAYRILMPTVAVFYGIIVRMYFAPKEHPPAHIHAYYNDHEVVVGLSPIEVLEGHFPKRQLRLLLAWCELHQEDLLANWQLVMTGEQPVRLPPL